MTDFYQSPVGEFDHPWLSKPDTKFDDGGVYKAKLVVEDTDDAKALKAKIAAASQAAFDDHMDELASKKDFTTAKKKKWSVYNPFEDLEDDDGETTGATVFTFKQNAVIKKRDGEEIKVKITMFDGKGNEVNINVFSGTIGRIMFSMRPIVMQGTKQVGVRLDFFEVQIIKPSKGTKRKSKFDAVDDGWDGSEGEDQGGTSSSSDDDDGDY